MNWWRQLFSRHAMYSDLSEEIREHLQEKVEELVAGGMSHEQALAAARREFGNAMLLEERGRQMWQWSWLENILRDLRFACRQLRRNPGFTLIVVLTLTLAIGANTAVFSMVNALLLRPLPYRQPERLAALTRHLGGVLPGGRVFEEADSGHDGETWELVRDNVPSVLPAAYKPGSNGINLEVNHQVRYVHNQRVSATFFDVLGIQPLLGRNFTQEEDRPNGPKAVILSYAFWRSLFAGDANILGQAIHLKGVPYTVVGVMPPGAETTAAADLWTPIQPWRRGEGGGINYRIVMRLKDDATWAQVDSQLAVLHPGLFDRFRKDMKAQLMATPFQEALAQEKRTPTLILMSAVGVILLIAAANLTGLMLVRLSRRKDEIRTRLALGAPRSAIMRQAFMEPLLLSLAGAFCGLALALLGLKSFAALFPPDMLPFGGISIDGRVLTFTALCTAGVSIFIGMFTVSSSGHVQIRPTTAGRMSGDGAPSGRTRHLLIGAEVCLTLVLLAGAGLLVRTLVYLQTLPPGFDASNVLTARASLDNPRYHDPAAFQSLVRESLAAMKQIPGVESAAVGLSLPYEVGLNDGVKILDAPKGKDELGSSTAYITPEYFRALRIPILAGRAFTDDDASTSEPVVVVNVSFAKQHLGTLDVVGLHLGLGDTICSVVGLVGNVKKPPGMFMNAPLSTEPMFYIPFTQVDQPYLKLVHGWFQPSWMVRGQGPIAGLPEAMQRALSKADPELPFSSFHSLDDLEATALSQQRVEVLLLTVLSGLAFLLSIVGVYGLVSNMVVQRRREIGIRMALGCQLGQAMTTVAGSGLVAVGFGLGTGLILSAFALRVLKSQLYGVRNLDPATLIGVSLFLLSAALLASFAPTLRIARIDPAATLRAE
ncbi:MAG TPA: ABC transporter permease [Candidatus Angelobacter sp.]